jgi:hydroxyethylthiazole kinase-like uncharacterized protein yjeF
MRSLYDADAIRVAEQPLLDALPPGTLMQRAATGLARRCAQLLGATYGARVVLLVGSGNNGGDALYAGAALARRGARVDGLYVSDTVHTAGRQAYAVAGGRGRPAGADDDAGLLGAADLVVDGMLGIGATGPLRPAYARLSRLARECGAPIVAVDVPSGVDATTGMADPDAVRADVTVTFGGWKIGLLVAPGAEHAGAVDVVDIGLSLPHASVTALDAADVAALLPVVGAETDKYRRGVLGVVAGSDRYTGAAVLAVGGALATGVGMLRFVGARHPGELVRRRWPEAVVVVAESGDAGAVGRAGRVQAWVVGSGLGTDEAAAATVRAVLQTDEPVLVDADAITLVAEHPEWLHDRRAPTLLTPHAGEFARLHGTDRGDVEAHALRHVRAAARDLGVTVLLKGASTLVADPDGRTRVNTAQTPYLATAGSGDVLSGVCGALLAGGASALDAGSAGAFLHGLAGLAAAGAPPGPITAMDVVRRLPHAVRAVRG